MENDDRVQHLCEKLESLSVKLQNLEKRTRLTSEDNGAQLEQNTLLLCRPIGYIKSGHSSKNGTPRQASLCANITASLTVSKNLFTNAEHALDDLKEFTYVWLIFWFHLNGKRFSKAKVKPPRLGGSTSKSVFATRSPHRPNPLGLSLVRLHRIVGDTLLFTGVDLVDGTPVFDIKPFIATYDSPVEIAKSPQSNASNWVTRIDESQQRLDSVLFTSKAVDNLKKFHERCPKQCEYCLHFVQHSLLSSTLENLLLSDLRSGYRKNQCSDRIHFITLDSMKLSVWYDIDGGVHVLNVTPHQPENVTELKKNDR